MEDTKTEKCAIPKFASPPKVELPAIIKTCFETVHGRPIQGHFCHNTWHSFTDIPPHYNNRHTSPSSISTHSGTFLGGSTNPAAVRKGEKGII